jgi:hypothetical protein
MKNKFFPVWSRRLSALMLTSIVMVCVLPASVWAQTPARIADIPPPPADSMPLDNEGLEEPQVTIRPDARGIVEEYRMGGKLYLLKITPEQGVPYFLIDQTGDGHFEPVPDNVKLTPPMWVIGTF